MFKGLFEAATYMELSRLPELFCGFQRGRGRGPTLYPVACSPQAWAAATPFALLQASLGLWFDPAENEIRLRQSASAGIPRRGDAAQPAAWQVHLDLVLRRHGQDVSLQVLRNDGRYQGHQLLFIGIYLNPASTEDLGGL